MGALQNFWARTSGKISFPQSMWSRNWRDYVKVDASYDYSRNDYDLYRSLYYSASINGKAKDMLLGSMLSKKIVNTSAGFAMSGNISAKLSDEISNKDKVEQDINNWLTNNHSQLLESVIYSTRDGDSYLYIDEFGILDEVDAKSVEVVLDPQTGLVVGYDVVESYTQRNPDGTEEELQLVKQYRTDSIKYTQYAKTDKQREHGKVIYYKVYTENGSITPTENQQFITDTLINRPLPIIHFANDREPRAVYGNSELLNCIVGFRQYHAILANATKGVINNSHPVPYIAGAKSPDDVARQSNADEDDGLDEQKINWQPDSIIFLTNPDVKIGYAQANSFMSDVGQLLEYYFYLIIEASETPEFVFGTAVSSSKASVSEQMPIVVQKAERKRSQLKQTFQSLVEGYIDRQIRLSNPIYLPLKNKVFDINIIFPDIVDEDKQFTLETIKFLVQESLISDQTALTLLMSSKIEDPKAELENAKKENEEKANNYGLLPEQPNRLQDEADASDKKKFPPTNNKQTMEETTDLLDGKEVIAEIGNPYRDARGRFAKKGMHGGGDTRY